MTAGALVIIGGRERKDAGNVILQEVAQRLRGGRLVLATVASSEPEGYFETYRPAFEKLGVTDLVELYVENRDQAHDEAKQALMDGAAGVYFTGGDQLRITSQIGDTPLERRIYDLHRKGAVIAGTSAGASVMSDTMLVRGSGAESHRIGDLRMAAGLGLVKDVVIDQHFAERGRIGRLLGAVSQNPRTLGIGIDEDTAIVLEGDSFRVIGSGGVTVVDGHRISHSNIADAEPDRVLSLFDVTLHVLGSGDCFDIASRTPRCARQAEEE